MIVAFQSLGCNSFSAKWFSLISLTSKQVFNHNWQKTQAGGRRGSRRCKLCSVVRTFYIVRTDSGRRQPRCLTVRVAYSLQLTDKYRASFLTCFMRLINSDEIFCAGVRHTHTDNSINNMQCNKSATMKSHFNNTLSFAHMDTTWSKTLTEWLRKAITDML